MQKKPKQKPNLKKQQQRDETVMRNRSFSVQRNGIPVLHEFYQLLIDEKFSDVHESLYTLKDWIIVPFSDWPNDFTGIGRYVCKELQEGKKLGKEFDLFIHLIKQLPSASQQEAVDKYEHFVHAGYYDPYVRDHVKYKERTPYSTILNTTGISSGWTRSLT